MRRFFIIGSSIVTLLAGPQLAVAGDGVSGSASAAVEILGPIEAIKDGSFEDGSPNPFWNQWSSTGITPITDNLQSACGPRSGSWWVWYRGTTEASEHGVNQDVFLPAGAMATLTFYLNRVVGLKHASTPPSEPLVDLRQATTVTVAVDSTTVRVIDADDPLYSNSYAPVTVDISSFANGTSRTVALVGSLGMFEWDGLCIDDVSLTAPDPACATPGGSCENEFISPADGATGVPLRPTFQWQCVNDAQFYDVTVDDGSGAISVCQTSGTSCTSSQTLLPGTSYRASVSAFRTLPLCRTEFHTFTTVQGLTADFTWAPFSPEVGQPVVFTDTSAGQPTSWSWDFGDGEGSTQQNPTHTYTSAGPVTVGLTVSNDVESAFASHVVNVRDALVVEGGPEQGVSSPNVDVDSKIGTAVDRDGNRVIVWQQPVSRAKTLDNGVTVHQAGEGVFGRSFNPEDEPQGDEFEIGDAAPDGTAVPSVDFDGGGGFVVGWQSGSEAGGGVFGRQFNPDQEPGGDAFEIGDLGGRAEAPQVATRAAGDFLVVWEQYNSKNLQGAAGIFGRTFGAEGNPDGGSFRIDESPPGERVGNPSAASDASGNVVVVWEQEGLSKTLQGGTGVFGRFFGPSGDPSSEPAQIDSGEGMAEDPAAASSALGRTIVVWAEDSGKQSGSDIFGRVFSEGGEQAGEQFQVNAETEGDQIDPSVAMNASGEFVVSWLSTVGTTEGIVARYFDPQGSPLGSQFEVFSEPLAAPRSPEVTLADDDTVSVVYTRRHGSSGGRGVYTRSFSVQTPAGECRQSSTINCLNDERFQVQVAWRDFANNTGVGTAVRLTDDTGYFWFFNSANVELVVKVLDGTGINNHYWVFYGALSDVEYTITVSDTLTGNTVTYLNYSGTFGSAGDTEALPADSKALARPVHTFKEMGRETADGFLFSSGAIPVESTKTIAADCRSDETTLCLNNDRFMLRSEWQDFQGNQGTGRAVPMTGDTGYFWFFDQANVELITKVLDGTSINGHYWVFYGALSNVEFSLRVTDTDTGAVKTYENPLETFASVGDTSAFPGP